MATETKSSEVVRYSHEPATEDFLGKLEKKRIAASIPELAELTGLSEGLLYAKANQGSLPGCRRIGKRFLIHVETFENFLKTGTGE